MLSVTVPIPTSPAEVPSIPRQTRFSEPYSAAEGVIAAPRRFASMRRDDATANCLQTVGTTPLLQRLVNGID